MTDLFTKVFAVWLAGYTAMLLDCVATTDLGLSDRLIRDGALAAAMMLGLLMAIGYLSAKWHEAH